MRVRPLSRTKQRTSREFFWGWKNKRSSPRPFRISSTAWTRVGCRRLLVLPRKALS
jgi:hypothetical protein